MSQFTTTALVGGQYLVEGTDVRGVHGSTVLDGSQWDEINRKRKIRSAHETFDREIEAFYAPILQAAEAVEQSTKVEIDPLLYVVEQEASEGSEARREVLTQLDLGSVVLRAIDAGQTDRLLWVGDELVLAAQPAPAPVAEDEETEDNSVPDYSEFAGHQDV